MGLGLLLGTWNWLKGEVGRVADIWRGCLPGSLETCLTFGLPLTSADPEGEAEAASLVVLRPMTAVK